MFPSVLQASLDISLMCLAKCELPVWHCLQGIFSKYKGNKPDNILPLKGFCRLVGQKASTNPCMPSLSSFPLPGISGNISISWLYEALAKQWSRWLPESTVLTLKKQVYGKCLESCFVLVFVFSLRYVNYLRLSSHLTCSSQLNDFPCRPYHLSYAMQGPI